MTPNRPSEEEFAQHVANHAEIHKTENNLRDVILGGQDGLVNALGIILGVLAASGSLKVLVSTVIAATIAESISMGAVAYTSALAQRDYYLSERRVEEEEIEQHPEMEKEEVRRIYEQKGLKGASLEELVSVITSDKKLWVETMMTEELKIQPVDTSDAQRSALIVTVATTIGHLIPAAPFFILGIGNSLIWSVTVSALTLFAIGSYQALSLIGSWWKTGTRMLIIGLGSALAGYLIARVLGEAV